MTDEKSNEASGPSPWSPVALGIAFIVALGVGVLAGFALGQANASDETAVDVAMEVQEVTRQVVVTSTALIESSGTDITSGADGPVIESADNSTVTPLPATQSPETATPLATVTPLPTSGEVDDTRRLEPDAPIDDDFSVYDEVWELINEEFDGQLPTEEERLHSAISGSLRTLDDDYTRYIRPDLAQQSRDELGGSITGIGAFVRLSDEGLVEIVRPIDGQPADLIGLLAGDVIIEVNGVSVVNDEFEEVLGEIRGPVGSTVIVTIVRTGEEEPLAFEIVRALIEVPIVESELLQAGDTSLAYIRLTSFTRNSETQFREALTSLLASDPSGIIFDLRDNGGGLVDQAVGIVDLFLGEGIVVQERGSNGFEQMHFATTDGALTESLPLVVLVNVGSASASEIVAGAIQDYDRGILVGETTFGKGSVQLVHELSDGSELRVTAARWYTPNNRSIGDSGIVPDFEVESPTDLGGEQDGQLQRAIELLIEQ